MGIRRWVYDRLSGGQVDELDPGEPIQVAVVMASEGPMTVSALQTTGLHAVAMPCSNAWTPMMATGALRSDRVEILVPRREVAQAEEVLRELRADPPAGYVEWVVEHRTEAPPEAGC